MIKDEIRGEMMRQAKQQPNGWWVGGVRGAARVQAVRSSSSRGGSLSDVLMQWIRGVERKRAGGRVFRFTLPKGHTHMPVQPTEFNTRLLHTVVRIIF